MFVQMTAFKLFLEVTVTLFVLNCGILVRPISTLSQYIATLPHTL